MTSQELIRLAANLAADKKAIDIVAIDLTGLIDYTDYFLICTGRSDRQVKAIHDGIREGVKEASGLLPVRTEGEREKRWVLLDYGDCIIHVMVPEMRQFYALEELWGDGPKLKLEFSAQPVAAEVGD